MNMNIAKKKVSLHSNATKKLYTEGNSFHPGG